ncbi:MAG: DUF1538 domain-containing protein [Xanthomonadaceae bacterium]|nr:DUF1538 domain-containing protein [Xanthomonadaceae bacterium]
MDHLKDFWETLKHAFHNLMPIILVVAVFQLLVMRQVPDGLVSITIGLLVVVLGVALFLQGLEMGIFPIGKGLSNAFAKRGSLPLLLAFGFALGFSAVIAEPALIAVAGQAELISEGRVNALTLRLIVAISVGIVVAVGVLRIVTGQPLHWYMMSTTLARSDRAWLREAPACRKHPRRCQWKEPSPICCWACWATSCGCFAMCCRSSWSYCFSNTRCCARPSPTCQG